MMLRRLAWPWWGLIPQLFAWIILPLTILLLVFAFANTVVHQRAMRSMIAAADERTVRSAAAAISAEIDHRLETLRLVGQASKTSNPESVQRLLDDSSLQSTFEHGIALFSSEGSLLAASESAAPGNGENGWLSLVESSSGQPAILPRQGAETSISPPVQLPGSVEKVIIVAYRLPGDTAQAATPAVIAGALSPDNFVPQTLSHDLHGGEMSFLLFSTNGQLIYSTGSQPEELGYTTDAVPGLREALGGQSGSVTINTEGGERMIAYSPVPAAGWALLAEESWEMLASPALEATQLAPLILVPLLLIFLAALWFGARQIVQPLQSLEKQAASVAWGDYEEIERPVGGIAEIRRLQAELIHLTQKVRASQQSLHNYIGAITAGQEEERSRLARELHDDTIQSLIALKQRVQLARMALDGQREGEAFAELESLSEQTIANLRRVTRALRPIYLEDLGLVAALEMLANEAGQASGVTIHFNRHGEERRLPANVELSLYRIAQEAISNVVRHSGASQAELNIRYDPDRVTLKVHDNGKGFAVPSSPAEFAPGGHFGLLGLHERAELIGAKIEIQSASGKGTQLTLGWRDAVSERKIDTGAEDKIAGYRDQNIIDS